MNDNSQPRGDTEQGIAIAGVEYMCRICKRRLVIYVKPIHREGRPVVDLDSQHRITTYECRRCGQERTHVAVQTLPDRFRQSDNDQTGIRQ